MAIRVLTFRVAYRALIWPTKDIIVTICFLVFIPFCRTFLLRFRSCVALFQCCKVSYPLQDTVNKSVGFSKILCRYTK